MTTETSRNQSRSQLVTNRWLSILTLSVIGAVLGLGIQKPLRATLVNWTEAVAGLTWPVLAVLAVVGGIALAALRSRRPLAPDDRAVDALSRWVKAMLCYPSHWVAVVLAIVMAYIFASRASAWWGIEAEIDVISSARALQAFAMGFVGFVAACAVVRWLVASVTPEPERRPVKLDFSLLAEVAVGRGDRSLAKKQLYQWIDSGADPLTGCDQDLFGHQVIAARIASHLPGGANARNGHEHSFMGHD